ncbi:MAG: DNA primase [Deltaproteobacteria bacterium]|nr:DNA primase [Deltaproteobacteria bacterium]
MSAFDAQDIETIKSRLNIVDVVGRYVNLRRAGSRWTGPCPFHAETKPSFSVSNDPDLYYCFGCQASGDVIRFFQEINGLDFLEAVEQLAREAGVVLKETGPKERRKIGEKQAFLDMHSEAQKHFRSCLASRAGDRARKYLDSRGVSQDSRDRFGIGYALDEWQSLLTCLKGKGFAEQACHKAGLMAASERGRVYDRFRNRIMFPIHDLSGRILAFGGRTMAEDGPKYINSSDSAIYTKGDHLYGLYQARPEIVRSRTALITEGYLDVISLHQHGFTNSCGVLGTALTELQVRRLTGLAKRIELVFDADRAGQQAALRGAQIILAHGLDCMILCLPNGEDADSLLGKRGPSGFEALRKEMKDGFKFCLDSVRGTVNPGELMNWAVSFVRGLSRVELKAFYLPRLASGLGLSEQELRQALGERVDTRLNAPAVKASFLASQTPAQRDRHLLSFCLRHGNFLEELAAEGMDAGLVTDRGRIFWDKLVVHGPTEVVPHLDEGEREFFYACTTAPGPDDQDTESSAREMEAIRAFLRCMFWRRKLEMLKLALSSAERSGNVSEINRLLAQIQEAKEKSTPDQVG